MKKCEKMKKYDKKFSKKKIFFSDTIHPLDDMKNYANFILIFYANATKLYSKSKFLTPIMT